MAKKKASTTRKNTRKKSARGKTGEPVATRTVYKALGWAMLAGLWLLIAAALVSFDPADAPGHTVAPQNEIVTNWAGQIGADIAHRTYRFAGPGIWVLMTGWLTFLVLTAAGKPVKGLTRRLVGLILMSIAASTLLGISMPNAFDRPEGSGGLLANYINEGLLPGLNIMGTMLAIGMVFLIGSIMAADQAVLAASHQLGKLCMSITNIGWPRPVLVGALSNVKNLPSIWKRNTKTKKKPAKKTNKRKSKSDRITDLDEDELGEDEEWEWVDVDEEDEEEGVEYEYVYEDEDEEEDEDNTEIDAEADIEDEEDDDDIEAEGSDAPDTYIAAKKEFTADELRSKIKQLPINFAPQQKQKAVQPREMDLSGYQFPSIDILAEPETNFTKEQEVIVREQALSLEHALQQYRIQGEVVGVDSGPVITLFEVRLAPGTKVARLNTISSDLARALKAHNIRIVPNTAGKDTVGIEVPNIKKERVRLKELMTSQHEKIAKMNLPMFLGKDASGNPLIQDLAAMPHMLIAGTTGSGKSVCMNSIIMSFLYTKRPDELKLVLVDPKMVEMSMFKDIPHLMCPVVTEMSKAASILEWAVTKMDERYELLAEAGVRDISGYNGLSKEELVERFSPATEEEEARIPKKLPYLVFVIDELADLMITNKEVEDFIVRIAQKARAVGIHLILATQRPQANVVTGLIKGNMPCRIGFKVASGLDSRIVLDQKGAELLLGHGDMLFLSPRSSKLSRAQATLVDDVEIRTVVKFLKKISQQNFEPQLMQIKSGATVDEEAVKDPLFEDAVRVVLESKRGSVSLLQRRLTIGYSRSSRLIEAMAAAGILGAYKGSQAREVNISLDEWEALKAQAEADAAVEVNGRGVDDPAEALQGNSDFDDDADIAEAAAADIDAVDEDEMLDEVDTELEATSAIEDAATATVEAATKVADPKKDEESDSDEWVVAEDEEEEDDDYEYVYEDEDGNEISAEHGEAEEGEEADEQEDEDE